MLHGNPYLTLDINTGDNTTGIIGRMDLRRYYRDITAPVFPRGMVQDVANRGSADGGGYTTHAGALMHHHDHTLHGRITAPTRTDVQCYGWLTWWRGCADTIGTRGAKPVIAAPVPVSRFTFTPSAHKRQPIAVVDIAPTLPAVVVVQPARPRDIKRPADGIGWIIDHPAHAGMVYASRTNARAALPA